MVTGCYVEMVANTILPSSLSRVYICYITPENIQGILVLFILGKIIIIKIFFYLKLNIQHKYFFMQYIRYMLHRYWKGKPFQYLCMLYNITMNYIIIHSYYITSSHYLASSRPIAVQTSQVKLFSTQNPYHNSKPYHNIHFSFVLMLIFLFHSYFHFSFVLMLCKDLSN